MIIVVEGSSIFNIDYAAGIFAGVLNPCQDITLLLNDKPILSGQMKHRKYISRLSFPLTKWIYSNDNDKKSNDNVWHLEYLPAEEMSKENVHIKFEAIEESICTLFKRGKCLEYSEGIKERITKLSLLANNINQSKKNKWYVLFYAAVIGEIFNETLGTNLKVELLGGFNKLDTTAFNRIGILSSQLFQELKSMPKGEYKFIKGGYIEVTKGKARPLKADIVSMIDSDKLLLKNSISQRKYLFKINDLNTKYSKLKMKHFGFSCRGPIQMLMIRRFGILAHLPWYGKAEPTDSDHPCHEYISPISVSDKSRVSKRLGGGGNRLFPSGYSLLDYESDEVLCLIRGIVQDEAITFDKLYDWQDLVENYPVTNEKLAEHQREVIPFFTQKSEVIQRGFRNGMLIKTKFLFVKPSEITFPEYGSYVIELTSFLVHIRNVMAHNNDIHLTSNEIELLQSKGWLNDKGMLDVLPIIENIEEVFVLIINKLKIIGFNSSKGDDILKDIKSRISKSKITRYFPTTKKDLNQFLEFNHICYLTPATHTLLEYYYSFVSFTVSTILKANIFTCYILFGPEKYKKLIQVILEKRGALKYQKFRPIYFQPINKIK